MVVELNGLVNLIIVGLSDYVFGSIIFTSTFLMLLLVVIALLIKIPVPFALAIPIPMAIVLGAFGYLTILVSAILAVTFLVLAVGSFLAGLNID